MNAGYEVAVVGAGPIGLIRDGDLVCINLPERRLDVDLTDAGLRARRGRWVAPDPRYTRGWLARYAARVTNAGRGAVLEWPQARDGIEIMTESWTGAVDAITHSTRETYRPTAGART